MSLFVLSDKVHRNGSCLFILEQTFLSETRVVFFSLSRTAVEFKHFRERWADGIMDLHTHCDNKKKTYNGRSLKAKPLLAGRRTGGQIRRIPNVPQKFSTQSRFPKQGGT